MTEFVVRNPRTGMPIVTLVPPAAEDVSRAVDRAHQAQRAWSRYGNSERAATLRLASNNLDEASTEIASRQAEETGKSFEDSLAEVTAAIEVWRHFADELDKGYGYRLIGERDAISRRAHGVSAAIVPWNYPILIAFRFIPGMLAGGNSVLWKPSEKTPLSAIAALRAIGNSLPEGLLQVLAGDGQTGQQLVDDPRVALVAFTGSTRTGKRVARAGANHLRTSLLELGGKDPVIVDEGVDVAFAADLVTTGALTNTGQICTSFERIYVVESVAADLIEAIRSRVQTTWRPAYRGGSLAPMIDEHQRTIVAAQVEEALARGARALVGGETPESPGFYYPATVLVDVDSAMEIMRAETFGPVLPIAIVPSLTEALKLADDTPYGLAATYIGDPARVPKVMQQLDVGTLWVNCWHEYNDAALHQPGRSSGVGAIGWRGEPFLDAVTQSTFVSFGG